ncbi:MAG: hypothetical protein IJC39_02810 [Firmicutes bacterium]|nr:hypothetical protein [Bacillota bacterium]
MDNIIESIMKARTLALNENIRANTVAINKKFGKVLAFAFDEAIYPPMICGMKAYIDKNLPEEYGFLMFEGASSESTTAALEYMEKQLRKHQMNYKREAANSNIYKQAQTFQKAGIG